MIQLRHAADEQMTIIMVMYKNASVTHTVIFGQ